MSGIGRQIIFGVTIQTTHEFGSFFFR
jgi:hypothetical protein